MSLVPFRFTPALTRAVVLAGAACLMPISAVAQTKMRVRVASDEAKVSVSRRPDGGFVTMASAGTILDVVHLDGDHYAARDTNWYLVLLPRDAWGRRHTGWISGRDVQEMPVERAETPAPMPPTPAVSAPRPSATPPPTPTPPPVAAPNAARASDAAVRTSPARPSIDVPDVVVHFAFDKSDLTPEAMSTLDCALEMVTDGQAVSFVLEGHADSTGTEPYNERLGLARAEAVRTYLTGQHRVPAGKVSVVSFGEGQPAASNSTRDGRAENRRVVVKVTG
jgi:outer membrane protein OmpA-like peptidoglycan-associated protein